MFYDPTSGDIASPVDYLAAVYPQQTGPATSVIVNPQMNVTGSSGFDLVLTCSP